MRGGTQEGLPPPTLGAADSGQGFTWSHPSFWASETTESQKGHGEFTAHEKWRSRQLRNSQAGAGIQKTQECRGR